MQNACGADTPISPHKDAHTCVVRAGHDDSPPDEIDEFRSLGLDFEGVRTRDDIEQTPTTWAEVLADERPDLLNTIVMEMAKATGVRSLCAVDRRDQWRALLRFSLAILIQRSAIRSR